MSASEHPDWYEPLPVFVYGTLRRGFANHDRFCFDVLEVVPAWTTGRLYDLPYGFPAMVPADDGRVIGEQLTFPDPVAALRRLDRLEGFRPDGPRHYDRIIADVLHTAGGDSIRAWCYVYPRTRLERLATLASPIDSGDWSLVGRAEHGAPISLGQARWGAGSPHPPGWRPFRHDPTYSDQIRLDPIDAKVNF